MTFTIGICALSNATIPDKVAAGKAWLEHNGASVYLHPQITNTAIGPEAGDAHLRAAAFHDLLTDKKIDAIMLACGGNRCMEVLPHINWELARQHAKPVMGFSDGTALLLAMVKHNVRGAWHGPTLHVMGQPERLQESDRHLALRALKGEIIPPLNPTYQGPYIGGNLSLTSALCGTPYMPDFTNKTLVIEDLGEETSRYDRFLQTLKLAGHLDNLQAVLVGDVSIAPDTSRRPFTLDFPNILKSKLPNHTPVIYNQPFGHSTRLHPFKLS